MLSDLCFVDEVMFVVRSFFVFLFVFRYDERFGGGNAFDWKNKFF